MLGFNYFEDNPSNFALKMIDERIKMVLITNSRYKGGL
jgi:hypothetical protein